jgi:antitoxin PrlF
MPIATLTSKGQVTLPAAMREKLRLRAGSKVMFEEQRDGSFVVRKETGDIRDLRGLLRARKGERPLTIEEMDEAIARSAAERLDRSR